MIFIFSSWNKFFRAEAKRPRAKPSRAEKPSARLGLITSNYGNFLGIHFLEVPLLIGVNWLILVFCTYGFVSKFTDNSILKVSISSLLMVLLDILIEPVAVKLGFWSWSSLYIPIQNYLMWFITSLLMHFILFKFHVRISFKLSLYLMISQLMFFIFLLFVLWI